MMEQKSRVAIWRLFLLSAAAGAINIGYAVEEAYAIPIIRAAGIPLKYATLSLGMSPVLGMIFQPFLGSLSDQCGCSWGRRKPFILALCLMAIIGAGAPFMFYLENADIESGITLVKVCVVGFMVLFDFSIGALQLPCRAFLLDIVPVSQSQTGNFIFTLTIAVNTAMGFSLGAVDWSVITKEGFGIQHQAQTVFGIAAVWMFLSMISTLFSIKERNNSNQQDYLKQSVIYSSNDSHADHDTQADKGGNNYAESNTQADSGDEAQPLIKSNAESGSVRISFQSNDHDQCNLKATKKSGCFKGCSLVYVLRVFKNSVIDTVSFIYYMSFHMWLVWFAILFGFFSEFSFVYGFTTFVGTVVYGGNSEADQDSEDYELYAEGVRMGSLALALSAIASAALSLCLDYITKWIRLKTIFLFILASFVASTFLMILYQNIYFIMVVGLAYGPFLVILLVVPYAVIPVYEVYRFRYNMK